jgi:putative transposase
MRRYLLPRGWGGQCSALPTAHGDHAPYLVPTVIPTEMLKNASGINPPSLQKRKHLSHEPPSWLEPGSVFFITICCYRRGENLLCNPVIGGLLTDAANYYHAQGRWYLLLFVLMPDHLHMLVSFPRHESMSRVVRSWKIFTSRVAKVRWQRDFFDHRIRREESLRDKASYILGNPVRAGLVTEPNDWIYRAGAMLG